MIPVQMIVLLSVVMLYTAIEPATGPRLGTGGILLGIAGTFAFVILLVFARSRRAIADLHRVTTSASTLTMRAEKFLQSVRWATIGITVIQLWATGWGPLITADTARGGWDLVRYPAVAELVLLAPPLLTWLVLWAIHYGIEQAVHERTLPYRLAAGMPTHEMPTRGEYIFMQVRHQFFVMLPILGLEVLSRSIDSALPHMNVVVSLTVTAALLLIGLSFLPTMIVMIWKTQPLTGPLRDRLQSLAARHKLRYRNILVWNTHHFISNAAVLGYLPFSRYFLLSDALLEALNDQQIEAVFAHELGHVRHKHIWWYIALIMAGAGLATAGSESITWIAERWAPRDSGAWQEPLAMMTEGGLLLAFLSLIFSRISKQFEHQADWFATRHMAESLIAPPQQILVTEPATAIPPSVSPEITATEQYIAGYITPGGTPAMVAAHGTSRVIQLAAGAGVFASALARIVSMANRSYDDGGWLHPSPRAREELLMNLAADQRVVEKFDQRMKWIRVLIVLLVVASIAATIGTARLPAKQNTQHAQQREMTES